jgi:catechol 2,3-dioxygenase-like lactoylglutathione lyase family enzyme
VNAERNAGPRLPRLSSVVLGAPDASELASFYERLLGWKRSWDEPGWVMLAHPGDGPGLSFQTETDHVRPSWPSKPGEQQMQVHLDIEVDDLDDAGALVLACGAHLADYQPQRDVRVYLDPAGHPFCLWVRG